MVLKSPYIYQMYAYLRSQERLDGSDPLSLSASGIFLHPSVDADVDEIVRIQGHELRFATVDLTMTATKIIERLRAIIPVQNAG